MHRTYLTVVRYKVHDEFIPVGVLTDIESSLTADRKVWFRLEFNVEGDDRFGVRHKRPVRYFEQDDSGTDHQVARLLGVSVDEIEISVDLASFDKVCGYCLDPDCTCPYCDEFGGENAILCA